MILSVVELIAHGVGFPVATVLKQICIVVNNMQECSELCKHVYERLAVIYKKMLAMETKRALPSEDVLTKYGSLVGEYLLFLKKHNGKAWIHRVVTYKRVMKKVGVFQEGITTLMIALDLCHMEAMATERAKMEQFRKQQEHIIQDRLMNDATITRAVVHEVQQVEALSILRYELQKPDLSLAPTDKRVITTALDKVMRRSTVQVASVPEWFVPPHKVEYEPQEFSRGSFGSVHHGRMDFVDVVVKCLLVDTRANKIITNRFREEAGLWFKFRHKHVLTMYGACEVSSPPFIVCELASNGNLFDYLSDERSRKFTFQLLLEAASGLAYLHGNRVVHGDLKGDNILVGADRSAKIADFSFSYVRVYSASKETAPVTGETKKSGAMRWRAPECLKGRSPTHASDVFSFGMCILEAVSLEIPWGYHVRDDETVRSLVLSGELPEKPVNMPERAWALVERMCSFTPAKRPTLETVMGELEELVAEEAASRNLKTANATRASSTLDDALARDDVEAILGLLVSSVSLEQTDESGATLLIRAAAAGALRVTQHLLSIGANTKARTTEMGKTLHSLNDSRCTALHLAAHFGYPQVVDALLLTQSWLLERQSTCEKTALYFAVRAGHVAVLEILLKHGTDIEKYDEASGQTALFAAAQFGEIDCVRVLLEKKANVHATSPNDESTALHHSADNGHTNVIEELLQHGLSVNIPANDGETPLHWAAFFGKLETARALLRNRANIHATTTDGATAFRWAAYRGHLAVVRLLLEAGARLDSEAVKLATDNNHKEVVAFLNARAA